MRYLIAGGTGFLGEELAIKLRKQNAWQRNFDQRPTQVSNLFDEEVIGDIRNFNDCLKATSNVDTVFHNIAAVPLVKDKKDFLEINTLGTENLLRASQANGVKTFVFTSSSAVYGIPLTNPITHRSHLLPVESYGQSKLTAERICTLHYGTSMSIHIVRPRTILGQNRLGIFSLIFDLVNNNASIPVFNQARYIYDFIHVDDLTRALIAVAKQEGNLILNLGSKNKFDLITVLNSLVKQANSSSKLLNIPVWPTKLVLRFFAKVGLLPFAEYQIKLYGEEFYFEDKLDWAKIGLTPKFSNKEAMIDSYKSFMNQDKTIDLNSTHKSKIQLKSLTFKILISTLRITNVLSH